MLSSRFEGDRVVGGGGFEHGEDDVAATAGEADDGGVVFLSFGCSSFLGLDGMAPELLAHGGDQPVGVAELVA